MTESKRGGPGRGQGRKPLADDAPSVVFTLRLTPAQRDRLRVLGGGGWLRSMIDLARSATDQERKQYRGNSMQNCGAENAGKPDRC